jgi:transcription elongation GreA/GreB family factor
VAEKLILSTVSAWQLGEQFETTVAQKNDALREARIAKQDGDLSENAPYQAAKEKFRTMGRIQRRLTREMNQLLAQGHRLVDPLSWCTGAVPARIEIGTIVVVKMNGETSYFLIAGARDHHLPAEGDIVPLPYTSPLGRVLLNRTESDRFEADLNGTSQSIEIVEVRTPTEKEILLVFPSLAATDEE